MTIDCSECQGIGWIPGDEGDEMCPLCKGTGVCSVQNAREGSTQNECIEAEQ